MEIEDRVSQFHCTIPLGPPITHLDAAYLYPFSKTRLQVSPRVLQVCFYFNVFFYISNLNKKTETFT
ncbi:unnamed protein product [Brassica oleracea]|uniref:(rape) hypothetical protein n=1 Tax=Brassica napus TaxID=3708 RepID=A0A816L3F9_BRANA|nr:unnamed protein product [Brassica napus]